MAPWGWGVLFAGVALYVMVLSTMLRGACSRYPFVFAYVIQQSLSTVVLFSFVQHFGSRSREYTHAYWASDSLSTLLALLIIIHLIRIAMEGHHYRNTVYRGLLLGTFATAVASLQLMHINGRGFKLGLWMTEVSRDYYFAAVLLNAILWFIFMRRGQENKQLYLMTSGLGLQLTGAAIAFALTVQGRGHFFLSLAKLFVQGTYLANMYVWYVALKDFPAPVPVGTEPIPETPSFKQ